MNQSPFVVSRFQNRNGSFSWRVEGRLHGVRIRRNFKTQEEASAEKATLEIKAVQIESGRPSQIATFLTLEQVRDAEAAFRRLQAAGISLLFCADFTLANYSKPAGDMALADAAKAYYAAKERERDQHALSNAQLRNIRKELKTLGDEFKEAKLAELTTQRLAAYCERRQERAELRTWLLEEETPEMLAAVDVGIRSVETEPKLSAEDLRRKLKEWTTK